MFKIAIGTSSRYKINAINKALHELDLEFISKAVEVESGVSEQPHDLGETKVGSINRAKNALVKLPVSDVGLGVEFGYEPVEGRYHMVCWASIVTNAGEIFSEQSSTLELPLALQNALLADKQVADNLDVVLTELEDKELARLFKQYLKKRRVIYECVLNVTMRWILDEQVYREQT